MNDRFKSIIERTRFLNRKLRFELFRTTDRLPDIRRVPFYGQFINGMATESLGPFPEFILPTHPCAKTMQGYCSPCFFSKVPMSNKSRDEIYNSLIVQTQFIIDHFDDIVIRFQSREDCFKNQWDITFCYACNGSIFSNAETTPYTRRKALQMLVDEIQKRNLRPLTYIETCVNDYLNFLKSEEFDSVFPLLKALNAVIAFGFESSNEITRNLIYLKDLSLSDFEKAIEINTNLGLSSAAFLYAGFHSMTQNEIITDVTNSIEYLTSKDVMPIIMFPNLQEYTLPHLLYQGGRYNLIDPRTALKIFENAYSITKQKIQCARDYWLMGDLFGGPPAPPTNFFSNKKKISCDYCTESIRDSLQAIRKTHDPSQLDECINSLKRCTSCCDQKYLYSLKQEEKYYGKTNIIDRIEETIQFAEEYYDEYIHTMQSRERS